MSVMSVTTLTSLGGLVLAGAILTSNPAAAYDNCDTLRQGQGATLATWIGLTDSQCLDQDKLWTYISDTITVDSGLEVSLDILPGPPLVDVHTLAFAGIGSNQPAASYELVYSLEIIGSSFVFQNVSLGLNIPGQSPNGAVSVNKEVRLNNSTGAIVASLDGDKANQSIGPVGLPGVTKLWVKDTVTINNGGGYILNSVSNTFTETPEPATVALTGLGVLAAGLVRRRRRA